MAEFCLKCFNILHDCNLIERDVLLDETLDLCENCGEYKKTIIKLTRTGAKKIDKETKKEG